MEKHIYFKGLPRIGYLTLEHVLIIFENEPILFICSNKDMKIFLCLCSDIRGIKRWIVSKSSVKVLEDLIDHKIDLYSAFEFQLDEYKIIVELNTNNNIQYDQILFNDIDELDLPEKMVQLEYFDEDSVRKFIKYIEEKQKLQIHYQNINYNSVRNDLNSCIQIVSQSNIQKLTLNGQCFFSNLNHVIEEGQPVNTMYCLNSRDTKKSQFQTIQILKIILSRF
jgi:CRISPR/Cas system CMR subunit Cmr4 (Cas7 group RAMP superfamily)